MHVHPLLVTLDVHPRIAMQILRHSQIAMTMEIYSEVPTAQDEECAQAAGQEARWLGLLYFCAVRSHKGPIRRSESALDLGGAEGI